MRPLIDAHLDIAWNAVSFDAINSCRLTSCAAGSQA